MKIRKTITTAPNVSQVRGYRAFIADKNPHCFCGGGIKSPIPIAAPNGGSELIDKPRGQDAATDEAGEDPHFRHREARSPP